MERDHEAIVPSFFLLVSKFIDKLKYIHTVVVYMCPKFTCENIRNMPEFSLKVFSPSLMSGSGRSKYFVLEVYGQH